MRRLTALLVVPLAALPIALVGSPASASSGDDLDFRADLIGSSPGGPQLFGLRPGLVDWVTRDSEARIDDGELRVRIRGLVVPATGTTNGIATVSASVACNGAVVATSDPVSFSTSGDAEIRQQVTLPMPCASPAVLVRPGTAPRYIAFSAM